MTTGLPANATIGDVIETLRNPEEYLRGLLGNMHPLERQSGPVVVRIGVTGKGIIPNYRIDRTQGGKPLNAFDGQTHAEFSQVQSIDTQNWSEASTTYGELRTLLGMVRKQAVRGRRL